jgi:hypothetical protein
MQRSKGNNCLMRSMTPRLLYTVAFLLLMVGWFACVAVAIWITPYVSFETTHHYRKDPRAYLYFGIVAMSVLPSRMFLKATCAPKLSEMQTYCYVFVGMTGLLGVTWFYIWLTTTPYFGAVSTAQFFSHFNDLVHLRSRWNAGVSLVEGVLFLFLAYFSLYSNSSIDQSRVV